MEKNWLTGKELCEKWKIDANELHWVVMDEGLPLYSGDGEVTSLDALILSDQINEIVSGDSLPDDSQPQKIDPEQYASWVNMPEKVLRRQFPSAPMMADALMKAYFRAKHIDAVEELYGFPFPDETPQDDPIKTPSNVVSKDDVINYAKQLIEQNPTVKKADVVKKIRLETEFGKIKTDNTVARALQGLFEHNRGNRRETG